MQADTPLSVPTDSLPRATWPSTPPITLEAVSNIPKEKTRLKHTPHKRDAVKVPLKLTIKILCMDSSNLPGREHPMTLVSLQLHPTWRVPKEILHLEGCHGQHQRLIGMPTKQIRS